MEERGRVKVGGGGKQYVELCAGAECVKSRPEVLRLEGGHRRGHVSLSASGRSALHAVMFVHSCEHQASVRPLPMLATLNV